MSKWLLFPGSFFAFGIFSIFMGVREFVLLWKKKR